MSNRSAGIGFRSLVLASVLALAFAGAAGCGGSDDDKAQSTPSADLTTGSTGAVVPGDGATGPASAGDERPEAPDDKISERPGGPSSKGSEAGKQKKNRPGVSGGISPTPSSP